MLTEGTMQSPSRGICAKCLVTDVYDGDTVTIEVHIPVRVRLLDCWAPPLHSPEGKASRDHLKKIAEGKLANVFIPWEHADRSDDIMSFGRVLAHIWRHGDNASLSAIQVETGNATQLKEK